MKTLDYKRVRRANTAMSDFHRQARRHARNLKKRLEEDFEEETAYEAEIH